MSGRTMRWDCARDGCFNTKHRVDLFEFDDCFPGKIGFTDIDGRVEINGKCLEIEWKSHMGELPLGQKIMFERLTNSDSFVVCIIHGDAETTTIQNVRWMQNGNTTEWESCTIEELKNRFRSWALWAKRS